MSTRHEAPSKFLGQILQTLQEIMNAIGQVIGGTVTRRGSIAPEILGQTELSVVTTFPSSFGVQFVVSQAADLWDNSLGGDSLEKLANLISVGSDQARLTTALKELKARSASKYTKLLTLLASNDTGMDLAWESTKPGKGKAVNVSPATAKAAIGIVGRITRELAEPQEMLAKFLSFSGPRMTFEIQDVEDGKVYSGQILPEVNIEEIQPQYMQDYIVTLVETIEISTIGEEKTKWSLSGILPAPPQAPRDV